MPSPGAHGWRSLVSTCCVGPCTIACVWDCSRDKPNGPNVVRRCAFNLWLGGFQLRELLLHFGPGLGVVLCGIGRVRIGKELEQLFAQSG
jgi:hypothetical protein